MLDRPQTSERALIVQLDFGQDDYSGQLEEVRLLAESAGAVVLGEVGGPRRHPDPATYAGKGKVAEIGALAAASCASPSSSLLRFASICASPSSICAFAALSCASPSSSCFW